jgi:hypothetical protein
LLLRDHLAAARVQTTNFEREEQHADHPQQRRDDDGAEDHQDEGGAIGDRMYEHDIADRQHLRFVSTPLLEARAAGVASRGAADDAIDGVACRLGDASCASAHATIVSRSASGQGSSVHRLLLRLQRQYGNQHVGQVLRQTMTTLGRTHGGGAAVEVQRKAQCPTMPAPKISAAECRDPRKRKCYDGPEDDITTYVQDPDTGAYAECTYQQYVCECYDKNLDEARPYAWYDPFTWFPPKIVGGYKGWRKKPEY